MTSGPHGRPPGRLPILGCARGSDPDTRPARHRVPDRRHGSAPTPSAGCPGSGRRPAAGEYRPDNDHSLLTGCISVHHKESSLSGLYLLTVSSASISPLVSFKLPAPSSSRNCSTEVALAIADVIPGRARIQANATCATVAE